MKKILTIIGILAVSTMIFSACEGPQGPPGKDAEGVNWKIITFTVNANQWEESTDADGLNRWYTCIIDVPEIDNFIATKGLILCYFVDGDMQIQLPYVLHQEDTNGNLWTRTIFSDVMPGSVMVYVINSDFAVDPPPTMNFSLRLIW